MENTLKPDEIKINKCMELTVELFNTFQTINILHPLDCSETCRDIHDIQNRLFAIAHKQGIIIKGQL